MSLRPRNDRAKLRDRGVGLWVGLSVPAFVSGLAARPQRAPLLSLTQIGPATGEVATPYPPLQGGSAEGRGGYYDNSLTAGEQNNHFSINKMLSNINISTTDQKWSKRKTGQKLPRKHIQSRKSEILGKNVL
jgi:hypothetical protein